MNSPYTKHLDATLDAPATTAMTVPSYSASAPMIVSQPPTDSSGGSKAVFALVALVLAAIAGVAGYAIAYGFGPTWNEMRRYEDLARREGEFNGRDLGWGEGRKQGRTEMEFMAKYERLKNQASAFNQGWATGLSTGRQMGVAQSRWQMMNRYGYGRGYGYRGRGYGWGGYGTSSAIGQAQAMANATGQPVDVVIG